jgi:hypothetical protein
MAGDTNNHILEQEITKIGSKGVEENGLVEAEKQQSSMKDNFSYHI